MARLAYTPKAAGEVNHAFAPDATNDQGVSGPWAARVTIADDSNGVLLPRGLPPRCRIKWLEIKNATAVNAPTGGGTNATADGFALVKVDAISSVNSTLSTLIMVSQTATAANTAVRANPATNGSLFVNVTDTEQELFLIPIDSGGSNYLATNSTSGLLFSGTANVDVLIHVEQFRELDDA